MGLSSELTAEDFVPVGKEDFVSVTPPSIFSRVGQFYKDITAKPREGIAQFIEQGGGPFSSRSPLWTAFLPGGTKPPIPPPSAPARFAAGMVVPETPTQAALMALLPGIGKLGEGVATSIPILKGIEKSIASSGTLGKAIKGGLLRTGIATGAGAGTSALTGESPLVGGIQGAASNVAGEILRGAKVVHSQDVIPATAEGFTRAQDRFAPRVTLNTPQPGNWTRALVDDLPALQNHIRTYDDLLSLKSTVAGNRILRNSKLAKTIGEEIYRPFHTVLDLLAPNLRFNFPYLTPGRFGRLAVTDPTISEILPNIDVRILHRAGNLSPNEALTIIQQLKDAAFNPSSTGAIRAAAKKFATQVEEDFVATLDRINPQLRNLYAGSKQQYSQLKGLQLVISRNTAALFPGGTGGKVGLDPVAWAKALREYENLLPEALWPRFHNAVNFGGLELGGGAVLKGAPSGDVRSYMEIFPGLRTGSSFFRPSPKMIFPSPPPKPLSPLFRALPPAIVSGTQAAATKEGE